MKRIFARCSTLRAEVPAVRSVHPEPCKGKGPTMARVAKDPKVVAATTGTKIVAATATNAMWAVRATIRARRLSPIHSGMGRRPAATEAAAPIAAAVAAEMAGHPAGLAVVAKAAAVKVAAVKVAVAATAVPIVSLVSKGRTVRQVAPTSPIQ